MIPWASTEQVSQALRAAAAEDEDVRVRWAARYALRLADQVPAGWQTACAISGVVYLVLAGKVLDAAVVLAVLLIIVFVRSTAPGR